MKLHIHTNKWTMAPETFCHFLCQQHDNWLDIIFLLKTTIFVRTKLGNSISKPKSAKQINIS